MIYIYSILNILSNLLFKQQSLKLHIQATHEGRQFQCSDCEYKSKEKGNIESHKNLYIQAKNSFVKNVKVSYFLIKATLFIWAKTFLAQYVDIRQLRKIGLWIIKSPYIKYIWVKYSHAQNAIISYLWKVTLSNKKYPFILAKHSSILIINIGQL